MKKVFFLAAIACTCILAVSCKKVKVDVPVSKTEIPDELVGKWQMGNFNFTTYSSYNGTRPANLHNSIAYSIAKDGNAEQYIYIDSNDGSDLQTLTYRKGTITFDATTKTWKFCPASGSWRKFQKSQKTDGSINSDGLYPKYAPSYKDYYLEKLSQATYMGCTNDYDEDVHFEKVSW